MEENKINAPEVRQEEMNSKIVSEANSEIGADIVDIPVSKPKHNTDIIMKINSIFLSGSGLMRTL